MLRSCHTLQGSALTPSAEFYTKRSALWGWGRIQVGKAPEKKRWRMSSHENGEANIPLGWALKMKSVSSCPHRHQPGCTLRCGHPPGGLLGGWWQRSEHVFCLKELGHLAMEVRLSSALWDKRNRAARRNQMVHIISTTAIPWGPTMCQALFRAPEIQRWMKQARPCSHLAYSKNGNKQPTMYLLFIFVHIVHYCSLIIEFK